MKIYKRHPYHFLSLLGEASRGSKVKLVSILFCLLAYRVYAIGLRVPLSSDRMLTHWASLTLCSRLSNSAPLKEIQVMRKTIAYKDIWFKKTF